MDSTSTYQCGEISKTHWRENMTFREIYKLMKKHKMIFMYMYVHFYVYEPYCWAPTKDGIPAKETQGISKICFTLLHPHIQN